MRSDLSCLSSLIDLASDVNAEHLSLVGSVIRRPLCEVKDIDVYVVLREIDVSLFSVLCTGVRELCQVLNEITDCPWQLETRRGPFKPDPSYGESRQIHLLVEDLNSIAQTPEVTLLDWHNNGYHLAGNPISSVRQIGDSSTNQDRRRSCRTELQSMAEALSKNYRLYKAWSFTSRPMLVTRSENVTSPWSMRCLLKYCISVPNIITRLALNPSWRIDPGSWVELDPSVKTALHDWENLPKYWDRVRKLAIEKIETNINTLVNDDG